MESVHGDRAIGLLPVLGGGFEKLWEIFEKTFDKIRFIRKYINRSRRGAKDKTQPKTPKGNLGL
jgi:hypothetical protein